MRRIASAAAITAIGMGALLAIPTQGEAVTLNGIQCTDYTVTADSGNGGGINLEIHDCGPSNIDPFDGSAPTNCGNNSRDGAEQCDGSDLGGASCQSRGYNSGTLLCNNLCQFDESLCSGGGPSPVCGNGAIEAGEQCDSGNLGGESCQTRGFAGGTLSCNNQCGWNTSNCTTSGPGDENCPDGFLDERVVSGQDTFGVRTEINPGQTRRFCVDVNEPLVGANETINRIYLTWGDGTDYVCGNVEISMRQLFGQGKTAGPSRGTSGSLRFSRKVFRQPDCPECVARGRYQVTATGIQLYNPSDPRCNDFTIAVGTN